MTLNPEKDLIKMYAVQILKMKPIILINNSSYKIPLILQLILPAKSTYKSSIWKDDLNQQFRDTLK